MKRQFKNKNMKLEYCDFLTLVKQETRKAATNLLTTTSFHGRYTLPKS